MTANENRRRKISLSYYHIPVWHVIYFKNSFRIKLMFETMQSSNIEDLSLAFKEHLNSYECLNGNLNYW